VVQGYVVQIIVSPFDIRLKLREWFGIKIIQLLGNYMVPLGGFGFRAIYLKKRHSLSYPDFLSSITFKIVREFFVYSFGGLVSVIFIYYYFDRLNIFLVVTFTFVILCLFGMIFCRGRLFSRFFSERIKAVRESWYGLKGNRVFVKKVIFITVCEFLSFCAIFYFVFQAFNIELPFVCTFLVTALSDFSFFFRIAPAAFGTYEASVLYSVSLFGIGIADGLLVVGTVRLLTMFWYFSLGPFFSYILSKEVV